MVDVELSEARVRVTDTEEYLDRKSVAGLSHSDLGLVAIRGQLNRVSDTIPLLTKGVFECQRCGVTTTVPQSRMRAQEPHECSGCERQGPFNLNLSKSEWTDIRKCKLEEPPEEQVKTRGETISVFVDGDLVDVGGKNGLVDRSGERVTVVGELTMDAEDLVDGDSPPEGDLYVETSSIVFDESDRDDIDVEEHMDAIEELKTRAGDDLIEAYRDSIAPDIIAKGDDDLEVAMEALEDKPDSEHDRDVGEHVLESWDELSRYELAERKDAADAPGSVDTVNPEIPADVFRAAIVHAQETVFPTLSAEAKEMLAEFYVEVRQLNDSDGDANGPVPATARTLEAGLRLSTAFARAEFCDEVLPRHAERAINVSKNVVGLNFDPASGMFDAGRVDTGTSRSQKERREKLIETIEERAGQEENGTVPVETLTEIVDDQLGVSESQVEHDIEQLKKKGRIIEPTAGELRAT